MSKWWKTRLVDVAEITMGQSPKSETYNEENVGLPFYQCVVDFKDKFVIPRIYCSAPRKILEENDILLSVRAPVGKVNFTKEKCSIGRGNAGLRHKKGEQDFLFYLLKSLKSELNKNSSGSVFSSVSKKDIENLEVLYPPSPNKKPLPKCYHLLTTK